MRSTLIDRDDLLTPSQAARRLPGQPHRCTLWRWCSRGVLTPAGERIRLRYMRLGRRVLIAPDDLAEFAQRLAEADQHVREQQPSPPRTAHVPRQSSRAEQAEREADEMGI